MRAHFRNWLRFFVRTRAGVALTLLLAMLLATAAWYGLNRLRFDQSKQAAEQALSAYDFPTARRHLDQCLALRPNDAEALRLAVQASRRDGRLDEALSLLDRYRIVAGTLPPAGQLEAVLIQVQSGNVKEYVHRLIEAVEIRHPASEQILESLALGCVHGYRLDEASFWTQQLLDQFPHNPVGRLIDAQTQDTLRHREQSLELAQQLVSDYPNYERALVYLADLLFRMHKYEEALVYYREAHRRQPRELVPLLGLAATLLKLERLNEARPLLSDLERQHADNSQALLECGRFALQEKRPADAEPLLRRAADLAPYDHEIHLELATCLEQLGRTKESNEHLRRFQQIEEDMKQLDAAFQETVNAPNDPEPRLKAGRICLRNGQTAEGLRWLSGVLDLVPDHQAAHETLANYYESSGDQVLAERHRAQSQGIHRTAN